MSFQVGIGCLGGTMSFQVELCTPLWTIDVTDVVNDRMVKNTKTSISSERNITFLQNKKILKGYLYYKMINSQNVLSEAQFKNFFIS